MALSIPSSHLVCSGCTARSHLYPLCGRSCLSCSSDLSSGCALSSTSLRLRLGRNKPAAYAPLRRDSRALFLEKRGRPGHQCPSSLGNSDQGSVQKQELDRRGGTEGEAGIAPYNVEAEEEVASWANGVDVQIAYALLLAGVPLGALLPQFNGSAPLYFLAMATLGVYLGSHQSLRSDSMQKLTFKQSLAVPFLASFSLFGFYCLLRFLPTLDIRTLLSAYLSLVGAVSVGTTLANPLRSWFGDSQAKFSLKLPSWLLDDAGDGAADLDIRISDVVAGVLGVAIAGATRLPQAPFTLGNFVALCIVVEVLRVLSLGSFRTAATMLGGLLLYDVFWVFGSPAVVGDNVMVMVATSPAFDGPMKLVFPRLTEAGPALSILGLGDIAAPGLLIALLLRFDRFRISKVVSGEAGGETDREPASGFIRSEKAYFNTAVGCYVIGLIVTTIANFVSKEAQPALLYLVPSLVGGSLLLALSRNEVGKLIDYQDERGVVQERLK